MSITFQHEANISVWTFEKSICIFHKWKILFPAQCVWWISALIALQSGVEYYLDYQQCPSSVPIANNTIILAESNTFPFKRPADEERLMSQSPRDIQRYSPMSDYRLIAVKFQLNHITDPHRWSQNGLGNSVHLTQAQPKKGQKTLNKSIHRLCVIWCIINIAIIHDTIQLRYA